jgi:hypothetical protein
MNLKTRAFIRDPAFNGDPGFIHRCYMQGDVYFFWPKLTDSRRRGSRNFWWGDDMDEEKIGRGLGAAVGPSGVQGQSPWWGLRGEAPYEGNAFFTNYTVILHFLNSAVR